jgi:ankyrin repeat protein
VSDIDPHSAARNGNLDALRAALRAGVAADARALDDGPTLLHMAVDYGHRDCVAFLLQQGADPRLTTPAQSKAGRNALHLAAAAGNIDVLDLLLQTKHADEMLGVFYNTGNASAPEWRDPLRCALFAGKRAAFDRLIEYGADIESPDPSGMSVLHSAMTASNGMLQRKVLPIVRRLIRMGARVGKTTDRNGNTPLMTAAGTGFSDAVPLLLSAAFNAQAANGKGETALHFAARRDDAGIVSRLVAAGAAPNARDTWLNTPLHVATRLNKPQVAQALLDAGANPLCKNKQRQTAKGMATRWQDGVGGLFTEAAQKKRRMLAARVRRPTIVRYGRNPIGGVRRAKGGPS